MKLRIPSIARLSFPLASALGLLLGSTAQAVNYSFGTATSDPFSITASDQWRAFGNGSTFHDTIGSIYWRDPIATDKTYMHFDLSSLTGGTVSGDVSLNQTVDAQHGGQINSGQISTADVSWTGGNGSPAPAFTAIGSSTAPADGPYGTGSTATWTIPDATLQGFVDTPATFHGLVISGGNGSQAHFSGAATLNGTVTTGQIVISNATNWSAASFDNPSTTLTVSGSDDVSDGNVMVKSGATLSILDSATLDSGTFAGNSVNAGTLAFGSSANQTLSGAISGSGALTKSGTGTLTLTGASSFSGSSTINAGTLRTAHTRALGTGGVTVNGGGTLEVNATSANTGLTMLDSNWGYDLGQISTLPFAQRVLAVTGPSYAQTNAVLYGNGGGGRDNFSQLYTGMIKITTAGTYEFNTTSDDGSMLWIDGQQVVYNNYYQGMTTRSGTISLSPGYHTLQVALQQATGGFGIAAQYKGADTGDVLVDLNTSNAPLTPDLAVASLSGSGNVQLSTGSLIVGSDNSSTTFSGVIAADTGVPAGLLKVGGGTLILTGANTYTGTTSLANGHLRFGSASQPAVQGPVVLANPGSFLFMDQPNQFGTNSTLTFSAYDGHTEFALYGQDQTIAGLSSVNTLAVVQNSHQSFGAAAASSTLTVNQNFNSTYSGYIRNNTGNDAFTLSLIKTGSGTLTLDGPVSHTGGTTVNGGTLELPSYSGNSRITGVLTVNAGGTVVSTGDGTGMGYNGGSVTTINIVGGTVTSAGVMHIWSTLTGGVNMTGGTFQSNNGVSDPNGLQLEWGNAAVNTNASASTATIGGRIRIRGEQTSSVVFTVADGAAATDLLVSAAINDAVSAAGISKEGAGTMVLSGVNNYTGATTVNLGTLALIGGSHASPITVSSGASLGFTLGSPTSSTSSFNLTAGTVKIDGTPILPSYTLISSSSGITGTPVLDSPIAGYNLMIDGTSLKLVQGYDSWMAPFITGGLTGDTTPNGDPENDGMKNLLEYALNGNPSISDPSIQPDLVVTATDFVFTYSRLDLSLADTTQTFEYGSDLSGWTPVIIPAGPGVSIIGAATVTITDTGATDSVQISIPRSLNVGGKLFGRLQVVK